MTRARLIEICEAVLRRAFDDLGDDFDLCQDDIDYIRAALGRLRQLYGRTVAKDFGPKAFKIVREGVIQEGLSRKYINDLMARIRRIFRWGVAEELLPPSIPQALESVPGLRKGRSKATEGHPIELLSDDTLEATLPYLPPVVIDMVQFQRLNGFIPIVGTIAVANQLGWCFINASMRAAT